ncbi:MAG: flagellar motor switch protein FliG [Ignavibacteriae bacterium]|nr:flagellar motor switch protein FliG [Ignavibacteriota bacterium]
MNNAQPAPTLSITNKQKAALLVLSLDVSTATSLMRTLSQSEVEDLTLEITKLKSVPSSLTDKVIEEFQSLITAQEYLIDGGAEQALALLEKSLGPERAAAIIERVKAITNVRGFNNLKKADPYQVANLLQKEHPQTIALILSNLRAEQSSAVLEQFQTDLRNDVIYRIATLGKVSPALISEMEDALESVAESEIGHGANVMGGPKSVAGLLNKMRNEASKEITESIELRSPELAQEIKNLMFLFEDIIFVDDRGIQRVLREVDKKDLALALKVADERLKTKILSNMSERAQEMLREELQYMGPVRLKEVESAQARIVAVVKQLEESGEIIVAGRGGTEEVVV